MSIAFGETDLIRSICKDSFYDFVKEFWSVTIARKAIWNWHVKYLCDELQIVAERVFKGLSKEYDLIINISPGSTKSTICSVMFPAWVWTRMVEAQFITTSYTFNLAMDLSRRSRDIIISPEYTRCWDIKLRDDQNVKTHFMNTSGGFRIAMGTGGVTGFHGHFIIVDDPLDPNEALSEVELNNANTWMNETLSQRKVEKAITPTILIMQRLHQNDPSANMLANSEEGRVKHIKLPAEENDDIKPIELRKYYTEGLMDPYRLTREVLSENRKKLGEYGYAGQFQQDPVPKGGGLFKTERLQFGRPPDKLCKHSWVKLVRFWDKAGTSGGGAFTVGVLMGKDKDQRFWVLDVVRGQWDSAERERIIKSVAIVDTPKVVVGVEQEPGSSGKGSAEDTARNLAGWRVEFDRPTGDKEMRADPFSVQMNVGNVWMPTGALWINEYVEELRFFPFSTYKDQVDASSGAFTLLTQLRKKAGGFFGLR